MIANANSTVQLAIQIKNGTMKHANLSVEIIALAKKDFIWNHSTYICENGKYLKSNVDEIVYGMDIVSANVTSIVSAKVTSIMLTTSINKKVRYKMDCYIMHTALLVIILLFIIAIIYYHYVKHRSKQKDIYALRM